MEIYMRPKVAQGHLKKPAFKDAGKIRSNSTHKFNTLGTLMFLALTILPSPSPQKNLFPKALKHFVLFLGQ